MAQEPEFEIIIGNRQLIAVMAIVILVVGVFFALGYFAGHSAAPAPSPQPTVEEKPADTDEQQPADSEDDDDESKSDTSTAAIRGSCRAAPYG